MKKSTFKILLVGNSLSRDAATYLRGLLLESGYDAVTVAYLAVGGCSISSHWNRVTAGVTDYDYMKNEHGEWDFIYTSMEYALQDEEWDAITLQQGTVKCPDPDSFEHLGALTSYIKDKAKKKDFRFYWYFSPAFGSTCKRPAFDKFDCDSLKMYQKMTEVVHDVVLKNADLQGVIPVSTAFQNATTSNIGDTVQDDGCHASLFVGRYIAAMTFASYITGLPAEKFGNTYHPEFCIYDHIDAIRESVDNAIANPYTVTPSRITEKKSLKVLCIGDGYLEDSTAYLGELLAELNVDMTIGILCSDPSSIDFHCEMARTGETCYTYVKRNSTSLPVEVRASLADGLTDEAWDVIVLTQSASDFGDISTYGNHDGFVDFVRKNITNKKAKILWHLPWAYQGDFKGEDFEKYGNNQEKMYDAHIDICKNHILPDERYNGIIPTGTVIQGVRSSYIGDSLTRDGCRLTLGFGRYAASLCWAAFLTGIPSKRFTWVPDQYKDGMAEDLSVIYEAIYYALRQPYSFRVSKYTAVAEFGLDTDYTRNKE